MTEDADSRTTLSDIFKAVRDPSLSAQELRLWLLYRSYEPEDDRGAFPGDELLASHMGRGDRSVQDYRARLLEKGYLRQQLRGPKPAYYWAILPEGSQQSAKEATEDSQPATRQRPERAETECEPTTEGSQQSAREGNDSQEDSQEGSQSASPEYGEYGEEKDTQGEDSSLQSSSSPPQGGTDDKSDHQDDDPLDLTELDSVSGEDLVTWIRDTPASESAPTAYWVDGVRELWWGKDEDPVGHGIGATMRYLTTERQSHSDSHMDGSRFIVGCYLLRERGELMGLDDDEAFGRGLLLEHDKGDGRLIWYRALEAAEELERKVEDPGEALRDMDIDLGGILGEGAGDGR